VSGAALADAVSAAAAEVAAASLPLLLLLLLLLLRLLRLLLLLYSSRWFGLGRKKPETPQQTNTTLIQLECSATSREQNKTPFVVWGREFLGRPATTSGNLDA
jgi:hypothetical protein